MSSKLTESTEKYSVTKEGWLYKEGGAARSKWQSRWFVLRGDALYYFSKKDDSNALGCLSLIEAEDISKIGEHSGKQHCLAIVGAKGNKKVYYLAADSEQVLNDWFVVMKGVKSPVAVQKQLTYAAAEVYLTQGIRISGSDVNYHILASISQRVPPEKKRRDHLGWFCDKEVPLAVVLNLFSDYGWNVDKIYRSSALSPLDNGIHPAIRVIFSRSPRQGGEITRNTSSKKSFGATIKGHFTSIGQLASAANSPYDNAVEVPGPVTLASLGPNVLEGADDELIELMREFDIPLSLLQLQQSE